MPRHPYEGPLPNKQEKRELWDRVVLRLQVIRELDKRTNGEINRQHEGKLPFMSLLSSSPSTLGNIMLQKIAIALNALHLEEEYHPLVDFDLGDIDTITKIVGGNKREDALDALQNIELEKQREEQEAEARKAKLEEERAKNHAQKLKKSEIVARAIVVLQTRFAKFNSGLSWPHNSKSLDEEIAEHVAGTRLISNIIDRIDPMLKQISKNHELDMNFLWELEDSLTDDEIEAAIIEKHPHFKELHHVLKHEVLLDKARAILNGNDPAPNTEIVIQGPDGSKLTIRGAVNETEAIKAIKEEISGDLENLRKQVQTNRDLLRLFAAASDASPRQIHNALKALGIEPK